LKKEDRFHPDVQQLQLEVEFDNGNNSNNYFNMINERITISKEYNEQISISNIKSVNKKTKKPVTVSKTMMALKLKFINSIGDFFI